MLLAIILIGSTVFSGASAAQAKSSRAAEVVDVIGEVTVTKAGGARGYRAFTGMTLNQGDLIETGEGASLVLKTQDQEDEITIDSNTSLYLSELSDDDGKKKTKAKLWTGSIWNKVKTLVGVNDTYEVETPTAVMGVRGTNFIISIDPVTGSLMMAVGSGRVEASSQQSSSRAMVYPSQQLSQYLGEGELEDLEQGVSIFDLESMLANVGPSVIEAIIKNKQAIDEENAAFIASMRNQLGASGGPSSNLPSLSEAELDRMQQNLDNIVANIVKKAIEQNIVDQTQIEQLIEQANAGLVKKIDLSNVAPLQLTEQEKRKQEQMRQLEQQRKQRMEQEKQKQEELKRQNEQLLQKLEEQKRKQEEAKQRAQEEAKRKAEEALRQQLSESQRQALEDRLKAKDEEQRRQNEQAAGRQQPQTPAPPASTPGSNPDPGPQQPATKKVIYEVAVDTETEVIEDLLKFDVSVYLENAGAVYGAQIHLDLEASVGGYFDEEMYNDEEFEYHEMEPYQLYMANMYDSLNGTIFKSEKSTYAYKINFGVGDAESPKNEVIYSVTNVPSLSPVVNPVSSRQKLITIPLGVYIGMQSSYAPGDIITVTIAKLVLSDANGNRIEVVPNTTTLTIQVPAQEHDEG